MIHSVPMPRSCRSLDPSPSESPLETAGPDASPDPGAAVTGGSEGVPPGWLVILGAIMGVTVVLVGAGVLWFRRFPGASRSWPGGA